MTPDPDAVLLTGCRHGEEEVLLELVGRYHEAV
jgi:hypothetical protein